MARLILGWCELAWLAPWLVHHREVCPSLGVTLPPRLGAPFIPSSLVTRRRGEPQSVGMPVRGAECQTPSYSPPRAVAVGCAYGAKGDAYGVVGGAYDAEGDAYGAVGGAYDARAARMAP